MSSKIINSQPYTFSEYYSKMMRYGFLILVLVKRELKIKYSKTFIGLGWLLLQPIVVVVVYSIFFKYLIHMSSDNIPYTSFVFSGLVLWYLFTGIISKSTFALIESVELINKVSFPRLVIILAKIIPPILENFLLLILLFVLALFNGQPFGLNAIFSIYYFLEVCIFSLAIGILCSILALRFRDLAHTIPFVFNFGIWLTPVFFPVSIVPEKFRSHLLHFNPLASAIEGLRDSLFHNESVSMISIIIFCFSILLLLASVIYFIKFEKKIVENL
jgi:lipopolysaccharide transport system permease protein